MTVDQILKHGFQPEEVGEEGSTETIYCLDVEHPFLSGVHIAVHPKHEMIAVYIKDLDYNNHFKVHEAFLNEQNISDVLGFFNNPQFELGEFYNEEYQKNLQETVKPKKNKLFSFFSKLRLPF